MALEGDMGDVTNITLNGMPLAEALRQQRLLEVQEHLATEEDVLRRKLSRGRSAPVPLVAGKRGRKLTEIHPWVVAEIKALAADPTLRIGEIAVRAGQPASIVRLCFRHEGIKHKRGRKKRAAPESQERV
jgi:hypothetical protein